MIDKKKKRSKNKDAQLIIRISKEERGAFVDLCDELDTTAAREIRHFIRRFISDNNRTIKELVARSAEQDAIEDRD